MIIFGYFAYNEKLYTFDITLSTSPWWRHQVDTFSALLTLREGGIHRSPADSPHKGQWFFCICAWTKGWANSRDAGDLRRHSAHYEVIVIAAAIITDRQWHRIMQRRGSRKDNGRAIKYIMRSRYRNIPVLLPLGISRSNVTRYCTQHQNDNGKTLVRLLTRERQSSYVVSLVSSLENIANIP